MVYSEKLNNKTTAETREIQIKGWSNAKKKALIQGDIKKLVKLSNGIESDEVLELT